MTVVSREFEIRRTTWEQQMFAVDYSLMVEDEQQLVSVVVGAREVEVSVVEIVRDFVVAVVSVPW